MTIRDPRSRAAAATPGEAATALTRARDRTVALTDFDDVELVTQQSPLMSPLVWDLAHVGQQEEHWLLRRDRGYEPVFPDDVATLYDAFRYPRLVRPELPLLGPAESRRRIAAVRGRVLDRLDRGAADDGLFEYRMIAQHEQQHVETMLATHQLRSGPPLLAGRPSPPAQPVPRNSVLVPAGAFPLGADPLAEPWALDNELPQHEVLVPAFRIARVPVTNGEWMDFINAGGYDAIELWSPAGWGTGRGRDSWHHCSGVRTEPAASSGAGSAYWKRSRQRSRSSTCAGTKRRRTPDGREPGCPRRSSGKRPAPGTRPQAVVAAGRGETPLRTTPAPRSAAARCGRRRSAHTPPARPPMAFTS
jgi:hypothetical protein